VVFRFEGLGFRVYGLDPQLGFVNRVSGLGCRIRFEGFGFRVCGSERGLGFRV
jgi:hypothetical protein